MQRRWLRKKTNAQLIMRREMAMIDIAAAEERGRARLVKMMKVTIKEIDLILKERS